MKSKVKRKTPEIVLKEGTRPEVTLLFDGYRQMLEGLEDLEDLNMLKEMRKRPLKFRKLEDFLKENHTSV